jgi:hypothetical protein
MLPRPLVTAITILITLAWAVNVVVGFTDPSRHDPTINAIFAVVVGAIYALRNGKNGTVSTARRTLGRLIAGDTKPAEPDAKEGTAGDDH